MMEASTLTIAQRMRVHAMTALYVRMQIPSAEALKMARAVEKYDELCAALDQLEALKASFDDRLERMKRRYMRSVWWLFFIAMTAWVSLIAVVLE
ncbi:MAG TPA: hypothetical protein PKE59_00080 [Novosphingobium sp.]|jgi:hypothetical protein|nr:hypothetical protein [Novosphingobium sp.]